MENIVWREKQGELFLDDRVVLEWKMKMPEKFGVDWKEKRVQQYYQKVEDIWLERWRTLVYWRSCFDIVEKEENFANFIPWKAELTGEIAILSDELVSVGLTISEKRGSRVKTEIFFSDLWEKGVPKGSKTLIPKEKWKTDEWIEKILESRAKCDDLSVYSDFPNCVRKNFSFKNLHWTVNGAQAFFPQRTVAHGLEGVVRLSLEGTEKYLVFH